LVLDIDLTTCGASILNPGFYFTHLTITS
jgi:hypothetical protein